MMWSCLCTQKLTDSQLGLLYETEKLKIKIDEYEKSQKGSRVLDLVLTVEVKWVCQNSSLRAAASSISLVSVLGCIRWLRWLAACGSAVDFSSHCTQASTLWWRLGWKVFVRCRRDARKRWSAWQIVITVVLRVVKTIKVSFSCEN